MLGLFRVRLLALHHLVLDEEPTTRHFSGVALQTALQMRLHIKPSLAKDITLYDTKGQGFGECYRRVF